MADELPHLEGLLQDRVIEVADYQRPYAWGDHQLRDLWEDLDLLGDERHYAGTLVLKPKGQSQRAMDGRELTVYEVVDGQQRLTTCLILLDQLTRALRASVCGDPELADVVAEAVRDVSRLVRVNIGGVTQPRIRLGAGLHEFFSRSVVGPDSVDKPTLVAGEARLLRAAQFFEKELRDLGAGVTSDEHCRRLLTVRARVCYGLRFLVYYVESSAEVGVLFETLNDRGQQLSELEKVKNYLLYLSRQIPDQMGRDLGERVNHAWSDIFSNLAVANLHRDVSDDALLRAHWAVYKDPAPKSWKRAASIKAVFPRAKYVKSSARFIPHGMDHHSHDTAQELYDDVSDYVETLRKCSAFMRDLYDPNASYQAIEPSQAQEVRRISTSLMRTGSIANFRPLLLAARLKYPNDASLYRRLLTLCEIYAARVYVIGGLRSNTGQSSLFRAARELFEGSPPEAIESSIADSIRRYASDESVRAALDSRVEWYYRNGHKYVLYEYELGIVRSAGEVPPFGDLSNGGSKTTEHILPQNPSEGSAWWADFDRDTHRILVNSIGNLVLTRDNSSYSNKEYAAKRGVPLQESPRCYFSSSALARERELAQRFDHWTPETIEKRRQMIVVWALDRWSLSGSRRADPAHG